MRSGLVALATMLVLGACSQSASPPATNVTTAATAVTGLATAAASLEPRFNPTFAVGGGANSSNAISGADVTSALAAVPGIDQLRVSANSSPPDAKGADVTSVSIVAQDNGVLLKGLDQAGKRALAEAMLTAAATAWPKAGVSLLVTDQAGTGGQIIGSRAPGGTNSVIVS